MMIEIEAGYYTFRATGMDKQGEMLVINSYRSYVSGSEDLRKQQKEFLEDCKVNYSIIEPKLTHTTRDPDQKPSRWEYMGLVDLNSDF